VAYANVGMLALVLYDHVVHIDDEVKYIWSTKLSVGTGFYDLSRYLGVLYAFVAVYQIIGVSDKQCYIFEVLYQVMAMVILLVIQVMMIMRLGALYLRSAKLLILLLGCLFCEQTVYLTAVILRVQPGDVIFDLPATTFSYCIIYSNPLAPINASSWAVPALVGCVIALEIVMVCLVLYQFVLHVREAFREHQTGVSFVWRANNLVSIIIQDNVIYFILVFCSACLNLGSSGVLPTTNSALDVFTIVVTSLTSCLIGPYMMLSIRRHDEKDVEGSGEDSHGDSIKQSALVFASPIQQESQQDSTVISSC